MRRKALVFLILVLVAASQLPVCAQTTQNAIFQVSTIDALKHGIFDGDTTFGELAKQGDFGLGTFNGLDGEMIALDGRFFQVKVDGTVHPVPDTLKTPFAVVVFFKPDRESILGRADSLEALQAHLDSELPEKESLFAIRIDGKFEKLRVRSVAGQTKPYRTLDEVIKEQAVFELADIHGTLVGFRFPRYMRGVNVSGYHFHFISDDRQRGGHVLDLAGRNLKILSSALSQFHLAGLPTPGTTEGKEQTDSSSAGRAKP